MKAMKNFAAQQLSKKQMNDVRGGEYIPNPIDQCGQLYKVEWDDNISYVCEKDTEGIEAFNKVGAIFTPEP